MLLCLSLPSLFFFLLPLPWARLNGPIKVAGESGTVRRAGARVRRHTPAGLNLPTKPLVPISTPSCRRPKLGAPHADSAVIHSTKIGPWEGKRAHKSLRQFYNVFLAFTGELGGQGWRTAKCLGQMGGPHRPRASDNSCQVFCEDSIIFQLPGQGQAVPEAAISSALSS